MSARPSPDSAQGSSEPAAEPEQKRGLELTGTKDIASNTRELMIQLGRGNLNPARDLARRLQTELNIILSSDLDGDSSLRQHVRQTMFAIEDVLALVEQSDLRGASAAARDAAKEWRVVSVANS